MKKKILIVDDEANIRDLLGRFLADIGYEVASAESVTDGLRLARESRPDLLISDLQLEDGDGLVMIGQIKEDYADLPVILLTGVLYDSDVEKDVVGKMVTRYLAKTTPLSQIMTAVTSLVPLEEEA